MINACPTCHLPLAEGQTVCPWCAPARPLTQAELNTEAIKVARQQALLTECPPALREQLRRAMGL